MPDIMEFLTNISDNIRGRSSGDLLDFLASNPVTEPQKGKIKKEPLLAVEDGKLVMVVDHEFDDIPSWVEWDPDAQMVSIALMGGKTDEVRTVIKRDYLETLLAALKLLLVSGSENGKVMHYVPFLVRK